MSKEKEDIKLVILAEQMFNDNHEFYLSDNGVWLTDNVPVKYLKQ